MGLLRSSRGRVWTVKLPRPKPLGAGMWRWKFVGLRLGRPHGRHRRVALVRWANHERDAASAQPYKRCLLVVAILLFAGSAGAQHAAPGAWCAKWIDECDICTRDQAGSVTCSHVPGPPCVPTKPFTGCNPTPARCVSGVHCLEADDSEFKKCRHSSSHELIQCNTCNGNMCTEMACPREIICEGYPRGGR
jgi:hypothetical protein